MAFGIPALSRLIQSPPKSKKHSTVSVLVVAPTRELAAQIGQAFEALGAMISLRCAVIVGGLDMVPQSIALGKKPHVIVATPGRLVDHLEKYFGPDHKVVHYIGAVLPQSATVVDEFTIAELRNDDVVKQFTTASTFSDVESLGRIYG